MFSIAKFIAFFALLVATQVLAVPMGMQQRMKRADLTAELDERSTILSDGFPVAAPGGGDPQPFEGKTKRAGTTVDTSLNDSKPTMSNKGNLQAFGNGGQASKRGLSGSNKRRLSNALTDAEIVARALALLSEMDQMDFE